jgi:hypothetical protein
MSRCVDVVMRRAGLPRRTLKSFVKIEDRREAGAPVLVDEEARFDPRRDLVAAFLGGRQYELQRKAAGELKRRDGARTVRACRSRVTSLRAFVLLFRYSGLRIRDVVPEARPHQAGRLMLYTQKTGSRSICRACNRGRHCRLCRAVCAGRGRGDASIAVIWCRRRGSTATCSLSPRHCYCTNRKYEAPHLPLAPTPRRLHGGGRCGALGPRELRTLRDARTDAMLRWRRGRQQHGLLLDLHVRAECPWSCSGQGAGACAARAADDPHRPLDARPADGICRASDHGHLSARSASDPQNLIGLQSCRSRRQVR